MDYSATFSPDLLVAFITLFILELVLGIDNVIFLSILASKLPQSQQARARNIGLTLAMLLRIVLLFFAAWIISLTEDVFTIAGIGFSWSDLLLIAGGGFLIYKAVTEIHHKLEGDEEHAASETPTTFRAVLTQIIMLDIVFSMDSVITAVGMVDVVWVIVVAVVLSFAVMLFASKYIFQFVNAHPTVKMLALAFLVMVGSFLVIEGFGVHVNKSLIYAAMAFAIAVEALNLLVAARKRRKTGAEPTPVVLRPEYPDIDESAAVTAATMGGSGSVTLSSKPVDGVGHREPASTRRGLG